LTVSLALVSSASLGVGTAGAQSGGGDSANPPASTKTVKRFIRRQARSITEHQPAVFPNARIDAKKTSVTCTRVRKRRWFCAFTVYVYEESTIDPPAEYDPEWPIRQSTLRFCRARGEGTHGVESVLTVQQNRRNAHPRRLRIVGGWDMDCALREAEIRQWNEYGPDYHPNVSQPTPHPVVEPPSDFEPQHPGGLLPPPSGAPAGAPPGPMSTNGGATSTGTAHIATHIFEGCGRHYQPYWADARYWVYACFWGADVPPGAQVGIFNQASRYYEWYYFAGYDSEGRTVNRFFLSGTM
jgi:hypothetical protein